MFGLDYHNKIKDIVSDASNRMEEHIQMLYIQSLSISNPKTESSKDFSDDAIELYLKKRGYGMNYVKGDRVMVKDFTCVKVQDDYVEVWHDIGCNNGSVFINNSLLTGLPITLNYMERI